MKSNKESIKNGTSKTSTTTKIKTKSSKTENTESKSKTIKSSEKKVDQKKEEKRSLQKKISSDKMEEKQTLPKKVFSEKMSSSKNASTTVSKATRSSSKSGNKEGLDKKSNYSEKRGTSTTYMPKSNALRNSISAPKNSKNEIKKKSSEGEKTKAKSKSSSNSKIASNSKVNEPVLENNKSEIINDYEDDFEDYESDFQECTISEVSDMSDSSELEPVEMQTKEKPQMRIVQSAMYRKVEEERRFDSGHYEIAEARKRVNLETSTLNEPKEEYKDVEDSFHLQYSVMEEKQVETKSLPLSTDEGFEEERSSDFTKSPSISQTSLIEIRKPKKEPKKIHNRAKEIMSMIKLDTVSISLLECRPIPYEDFVKIFGRMNTRQIAVQTKEDNLDIEIQTDDIEISNKWTQLPVICRSSLNTAEDIMKFQLEQIGVGDDLENFSSEKIITSPTYDTVRLNEFLNRAGKVILSLLEKNKMGGNILQSEPHELLFSEGFILLSTTSLTFLCHRPVTIIQYFENNNKILMTIHPPENEEFKDDVDMESYANHCIGCLWNISEPSTPIKLFYSRSTITSCYFHPINYCIIFGGTMDGSINIWNLKEDEMWHKNVTDKINESEWILRSPSYTTAGNLEIEGHNSEIVGMSILTKFEKNVSHYSSTKFIPIQICTLDSEGRLIIWSVLSNLTKNIRDVNSSIWSEVKLNKSQEITLNFKGTSIPKDAIYEFKHMKADSVNFNNLYLATNTRDVMHATCIGTKVNPVIYKTNSMYLSGATTCIETCPFEKSYFMVGCNDGTIRLHSSNIEQPLLQLKVKNYSAPIQTVQWSKSKPFSIYVLDENSRIHIWDLGNNDTLPLQTLHITKRGQIKSMQLSPCNMAKDLNDQYLTIGTSTGRVEVHKLKREYYYSQVEHTNREIEAFSQYISIL